MLIFNKPSGKAIKACVSGAETVIWLTYALYCQQEVIWSHP